MKFGKILVFNTFSQFMSNSVSNRPNSAVCAYLGNEVIFTVPIMDFGTNFKLSLYVAHYVVSFTDLGQDPS